MVLIIPFSFPYGDSISSRSRFSLLRAETEAGELASLEFKMGGRFKLCYSSDGSFDDGKARCTCFLKKDFPQKSTLSERGL